MFGLQIRSLLGIYCGLSFIGFVMVLFRIYLTSEIAYLYLIWNLFLAWVPFVLSLLIMFLVSGSKVRWNRRIYLTPIGLAWLFFYPNAPYIITDFIHFRGIDFYSFQNGQFSGFNTSFIVWYDFVMNSTCIITGFLLGFISLFLLQRVVMQRFGTPSGWGFVVTILILSSFGIYLGRFIRWNSWDVISNPFALMRSVFDSIHMQSFSFTILFSIFLLLIYIALYTLMTLNFGKMNMRRNE